MLSNFDYTVLDILYQQGASKIIMSRQDIGDEVVFRDETSVLEFFNQNDWEGKTVIFSPTNTAQFIGTLAKPTQYFELNGQQLLISKFLVVEGE